MINTATVKTKHRATFERYLTEAEEKKLLAHLKQFADIYTRRDYWLAIFFRQTGVRVSVICGKDPKKATKKSPAKDKTIGLTIGEAKKAIATQFLELRGDLVKGGDELKIYANKKAVLALKELVKIHKEMGHAPMADSALVMSKKGNNVSSRNLQERFNKHGLAAVGYEISPHWFRHTLAKRIMKNSTAEDKVGIAQVQLGHSNREATAIYTMPDKEDLVNAMEEVS